MKNPKKNVWYHKKCEGLYIMVQVCEFYAKSISYWSYDGDFQYTELDNNPSMDGFKLATDKQIEFFMDKLDVL